MFADVQSPSLAMRLDAVAHKHFTRGGNLINEWKVAEPRFDVVDSDAEFVTLSHSHSR